MIYDVHSHAVEHQIGGFLLSIEGTPPVPGGLSFSHLNSMTHGNNFITVRYVPLVDVVRCAKFDDAILYFHFRRENILVLDLINFLKNNCAKLIILDTFSKFKLDVNDYKKIVSTFPDKIFLLAHGGGYEALDFIQLVRYSSNCFIDFSATQSIFSFGNNRNNLDSYYEGLLLHCFDEPRLSHKILFGSDNPEFDQSRMIKFYRNHGLISRVNENYLSLISKLRV